MTTTTTTLHSTSTTSTSTSTSTTTTTTSNVVYTALNKYVVCKKNYFEKIALRIFGQKYGNIYNKKILVKDQKYLALAYTSDYDDLIKSYVIKIDDINSKWIDVEYFYTGQELRKEKLEKINKNNL